MKFSDYTYVRPDCEALKLQLAELTADLDAATTADAALAIVKQVTAINEIIDTQANLWSIRHSIDMNDEFYNEETKFWNKYSPLFDELMTNYYRVVVASPFRKELGESLPETFFMLAENKLQTFSSEAIPLFQKENQLVDRYNNLMALLVWTSVVRLTTSLKWDLSISQQTVQPVKKQAKLLLAILWTLKLNSMTFTTNWLRFVMRLLLLLASKTMSNMATR